MNVSAFGSVSRLRKLAVLGLVLSVVMLMSVPVMGIGSIPLHGPHVGADSSTFGPEDDDGGLTDPVVWHFVLNQLDDGATAGTLHVTFQNAGLKTATGNPVGIGSTQHFYVGTPSHDVIVSAYVTVNSEGGKLVLSHVALNDPEVPLDPEEPTDPEVPLDPELPLEPEVPVSPETPEATDEPFLPFTEEEEEPFLPFTGVSELALFGAAAVAAAGAVLRRSAR